MKTHKQTLNNVCLTSKWTIKCRDWQNNATFLPKTKSTEFFDSTLVPCRLSRTPATNTSHHPPLTERANTPRRIIQPIMTEEKLVVLMLPLSVCLYECWGESSQVKRTVALILPAVANSTSSFNTDIMT